ncbi:MAG: glycosyltransferase family 39 protein, partial [Actinomycetota bacterium]
AVHGTYYLFMHFWITLFGASELSVRLPSSIAVGIAVAGVVVLGTLLFSKRVAVIAAIVFVAIPRVNLDGVEGRAYAMTAAVAVWLTIFFVLLVRSRTPRRLVWVAYGLAVAASIYLF